MEKKKLLDEKEELIKDIVDERNELKHVNDMINEIGGSVSFINFIVIPLVVAVVVSLIVRLIGLAQSKAVGIILVTFIAAFTISTVVNRRQIASRKKDLIDKRIAIQKDLVAKGKRLGEIEEGLRN